MIVLPDVIISQAGAILFALACILVVRKRSVFIRRYRRSVYWVLGAAMFFESLWLLIGANEYFEWVTEWMLKNEGVATQARIVTARPGARRHGHGRDILDLTCEFVTTEGRPIRAIVKAPEDSPDRSRDVVPVRYLPSNPSIVREEDAVASTTDPGPKWIVICFAWIVNGGLLAWLFARAAARRLWVADRD